MGWFITFALFFAAGAWGIAVTQGQTTWVPKATWAVPLLSAMAVLCFLGALSRLQRFQAFVWGHLPRLIPQPPSRKRNNHEPVTKPPEEPKPNLVPCAYEAYEVKCDKYGIEQKSGGMYDRYDTAIVLPFLNAPLDSRAVGAAKFVQAELIFRTAGAEAIRIHHALWFNEQYNHAYFQLNTMRKVLIFLKDAYHNRYRTIRDERESSVRYPPLDYVQLDANNNEYRVEVKLIVDGTIMPVLNYRCVLNPFHFTPIP